MSCRARALGAPLVPILAIAALATHPLRAQVSPGLLAKPHASLEGVARCTRCHGGGKDAMRSRCVACHGDVGWLVERERGFHGSARVRPESCASCHPDHAGRDLRLVQWPGGSPERFDHREAGWPLEQTHARTECADCHAPSYRRSPAAPLAAGGRSRWTGLEPACVSCHDDPHRGALGAECATCHDAGSWSATPGFDHDTTAYPLSGRHRAVTCGECHLDARLGARRDRAGRLVPVYAPVPHASCGSCHRDPHDGGLGASCADCHTTTGFGRITGEGFDHARTRFPLRGRHVAVQCAACHRDFASQDGRRPRFTTCGACHADAHAGNATVAGEVEDCAACHSERGFAPSTFPIARHQQSHYPLLGKHVMVSCGGCHRTRSKGDATARLGPAQVELRPAFARCLDCHADDHGGQLAGRQDEGECGRCHTVAGFRPSRFAAAEHASLRLGLAGRHAEIACAACHGSKRPGLPSLVPPGGVGKAGFAFAVETRCAECHVDPHAGRFAGSDARPMETGCSVCHDVRRFVPSTIDVAAHAGFAWPLAGAHRAVPCQRCHTELAGGGPLEGAATLLRAGDRDARRLALTAPTTCADCHQTPHGSQFDARPDRGRCDACHGDDAFAPASRFDHDRDASFPLTGSHQQLACATCHRDQPGEAPPTAVVYRPLPSKCEACHGGGA